MAVADFFKLPLVSGKLQSSIVLYKDSMKHLLGLQLWHLLKYAELNDEVIRQNEKLFIDLLNKVRLNNIGDDV